MAKKGKTEKNTATKQTSDTTKSTPGSSKDKNAKSQIKGNRSSARKKGQKGKGGKGSSNIGDDYQLRRSVEADGTLEIIQMNADGNCLFRALSDQLYGDHGNGHGELRTEVCDYMQDNKDDFSLFLVMDQNDEGDNKDDEDAPDFESYIKGMRQDGEWGGNLELVAAARIYRRKITVFSASLAAFTIDSSEPEKEGTDLLLSFHDNDHYNSVRKKNSPPKPISSRKGSKKKTELSSEAAATKESSCSLEPGKTKISSEAEPTKVDKAIRKEEDTTASSITSTMSGLSLEDDEKAKGKDTQVKTAAPLKKGSPCPCGSGIKYRKCCRTKEKQLNKAHNYSKSQGACSRASIDDDSNSPNEDVEVTQGGFRVLKI